MALEEKLCNRGLHTFVPDYEGSEVCPQCERARSKPYVPTTPVYSDDSRGSSPSGATAFTNPEDLNRGTFKSSTNKTQGIYSDLELKPVVGWFVAITGPMKGRDFRILAERNLIGRDPSCAIPLMEDVAVSSSQAWVSFDPRKSRFMVAPGNGSSLTYLNDSELLVPTELKAFDLLELGRTTLKFVPFCGPNHSWDVLGS
jgi:FHA domain